MLKNFEKIAQRFSLLCISQDTSICEEHLNSIFGVTYIVSNEREAYKVFKDEDVDIVFIDIDSGEIDVVSIIETLRQKVPDLPVVVLTAKRGKEKFFNTLSSGMVQLIYKPIKEDNLNLVVKDIVYRLKNRLDSQELAYRKAQEKDKSVDLLAIKSVMDSVLSPMVAVSNSEIIYVNKKFYSLCKEKNISLNNSSLVDEISELFGNYTDKNSFEKIPFGKNFDVKYNYQKNHLKKVFIPTKTTINIDGYKDSFMVVLSDIGPLLMQIQMINYQKSKIENYKNLVEELLAKEVFKGNKKSIVSKEDIIDNQLDAKDIEILRRDHSHKTSAKEFMSDLDVLLYDDVQGLTLLEKSIKTLIIEFSNAPTVANILEIANQFNTQGKVIIAIQEFQDLGNAVCSLSDFLYIIEEEQIEQSYKEIFVTLGGILDDLIQWRENIFEKEEAFDIHYLDASLFSSILQFQLGITASSNADSGELELF